ncbi:NUDIX domain-containing protein [Candidatus Saccharibacteria bacterium]|nr:NUDIX domain-containing protein [Candidatus Saccharibacteria bacterium]
MRTIKRDVVGAFIFSSDNKILLGKSRKGGVYHGTWMVPGGGIEEGETMRDAVIREIREEVGGHQSFRHQTARRPANQPK